MCDYKLLRINLNNSILALLKKLSLSELKELLQYIKDKYNV